MANKKVPTGVKIIAIFNFVASVMMLISGLTILVSPDYVLESGLLGDAFNETSSGDVAGTDNSADAKTTLIVFGVTLLIMGVLFLVIGIFLWKLRTWARITEIIITGLSVLSALNGIILDGAIDLVVPLAIFGFIGGYLLFSPSVKTAFKGKKKSIRRG